MRFFMSIRMLGFRLRESVRYIYRELKLDTLNRLGLGLAGSVWALFGFVFSC
jgi:hypothetical protein